MIDSLPESRRVLFYSHDGTGLGHIRITLAVATAYARLRPHDSLLLLTGSLQASAFAHPPNLDYIKLPAMPKRDLYASLPPTEGYTGSHNSTIRFRTALALATVQGFDPHLVVVDHAPAGLFREFAPAIEWLRQAVEPKSLALLMRDITFGPEQTRTIWKNEGVVPLLDEVYNQILIYGDQQVFDPITAYGMSPQAAARTQFCGYLAPAPPRRSPEEVREEVGAAKLPLMAISAGGGADGCALLRAYLTGLREALGPQVHSHLVTGPLLPAEDRQEIANMIEGLPNISVVDFDPDFAAVVRAADVVVCMGGYNSIVESVYFGKRPIVVPRIPGSEEQVLRAEGFARLGLARVVGPVPLSATSLWKAIEAELRDPPASPQAVAFNGLDGIARELAQPPNV
jgi:predicted glycosyltransferase